MTEYDPIYSGNDLAEYEFVEYQNVRYNLQELQEFLQDKKRDEEEQNLTHTYQSTASEAEPGTPTNERKSMMVDHPLLESPPRSLKDVKNTGEVLNFILDKAFADQPLGPDMIKTLEELFSHKENREVVLILLEKDYEAYGYSHLEPQKVQEKTVKLPRIVFDNVCELFAIFLE